MNGPGEIGCTGSEAVEFSRSHDDVRRRVFEHFPLRKRVDAVVAIPLELTSVELAGR